MTEATKKLAEALHEHAVTISDGWLVRPVNDHGPLISEFAVQVDNAALLRVSVHQLHASEEARKPIPTVTRSKLIGSSVGAITNIVRGGLHAEDLATGEPTLPAGVTVHPFEVVGGQPQFRLELTDSGEEYTVSVKKTRHCPSVGDPIPEGSVWQVWWSPAGNRPGDSTRMSYYTARTHSEACRAWSEDPARQENDVLRNASLYSSPIVEPEPEPEPPVMMMLSDEDRALLQRIAENTSPMKFTVLPRVGDVVEGNVAHLVETKPATMQVTLSPEQIVRDRYNAGEYNGAPMPTFEEAVHGELNTPAPGAEPLKVISAGYDEALDRIHYGSQSYERILTSDEVTELRHKVGLYVSDARASFSGTAVPDAVDRIMGALQR